LPNSFGSSRN